MFNYNPTVNDNSGQILAGYQTKSAEIKAAGNEALANGIMRGATSAIGGGLGAATGFNTAGMITDAKGNSIPGLGEALDEVKANAIKYNTAAGMMDAYKQNAGALGLDLAALDAGAQKFSKQPDKLLGWLTVTGEVAKNNMAVQRQQAQIDGYKELYTQKAQAAAAAKAALPPKYDLNYATEFNKALYDNGITDPDQRKQKFNEAGIGHLYDKFINPPKQNMGFFGPITQ